MKCPHSALWEHELFPSLCGLLDLFSLLLSGGFFLTLQSFPLRMYRSVLIQRFKETPPRPHPSALWISLFLSLSVHVPFLWQAASQILATLISLNPDIHLFNSVRSLSFVLHYLSLNCHLETVSRKFAGTIIVHISFVSFLSGHSPVLFVFQCLKTFVSLSPYPHLLVYFPYFLW